MKEPRPALESYFSPYFFNYLTACHDHDFYTRRFNKPLPMKYPVYPSVCSAIPAEQHGWLTLLGSQAVVLSLDTL